jgi:hypothetical protein
VWLRLNDGLEVAVLGSQVAVCDSMNGVVHALDGPCASAATALRTGEAAEVDPLVAEQLVAAGIAVPLNAGPNRRRVLIGGAALAAGGLMSMALPSAAVAASAESAPPGAGGAGGDGGGGGDDSGGDDGDGLPAPGPDIEAGLVGGQVEFSWVRQESRDDFSHYEIDGFWACRDLSGDLSPLFPDQPSWNPNKSTTANSIRVDVKPWTLFVTSVFGPDGGPYTRSEVSTFIFTEAEDCGLPRPTVGVSEETWGNEGAFYQRIRLSWGVPRSQDGVFAYTIRGWSSPTAERDLDREPDLVHYIYLPAAGLEELDGYYLDNIDDFDDTKNWTFEVRAEYSGDRFSDWSDRVLYPEDLEPV